MTHDQLQHDLALSRRGCGEVVVEKLSLGSYAGGGQIDVATMKLSWTQPNPTAYEVKISRADFLADTQSGKYERYLRYVRRLYFAAPSGLLTKEDIPAGCGLVVRGDNGWRTVKAPRVNVPNPETWPDFLQSLLMKHYPGPWVATRHLDRRQRIEAALQSSDEEQDRFRGIELNARIVGAIRRARDVELRIEDLRWRLAGALGEQPGDRSLEQLGAAVLERRPAAPAPDYATLRMELNSIRRTAERALERIPERPRALEATG